VNLPKTLTINASLGDERAIAGPIGARADRWGASGDELHQQQPLAPVEPAHLWDWRHADVGWGVVMADCDDLSAQDKAKGADAPEPIKQLIDERDAPIFRSRQDLGNVWLRRYSRDGTPEQDVSIGMTPFGVGPGRLPRYLLIVGGPDLVPWRVQYSLNRRHHVGRLALSEEGLKNYVHALRNNWKGMDSDATRALIWSVTGDSMTDQMDDAISKPTVASLQKDSEITVSALSGGNATHQGLRTALKGTSPALVVTSSHGATGPLDRPEEMRITLGLPVDRNHATMDVGALLDEWTPNGAVWYAHACCSAGSDNGTSYEGLVDKGTLPDLVTRAVGGLGATVAPLPTALLSAAKPLRAFIGHVEPTFDWTLSDPDTGQLLTTQLVDAVYPNLYLKNPVGMSLDEYYRGVGELYAKLDSARAGINNLIEGARSTATYFRLTATDRQSLVMLGDPTVTLPLLPSQTGGSR